MHIDNKKKSSSESSKEYCRWVTFARILNPNHLPERAGNLFLLRFSFYLSHTHISLYFPLLTNVEIPPTLTLASTQAAPAEPERAHKRPYSFSTSCPSALFVQRYARHVPLRYFPCKGNPPLGAIQGHMPYRALRCRNFPGSLPSFSPARGTAKRRYSGKLPPRSLVWLPEGDLINARKKRKRDKPRFQITKRPKDRDLSLKEKLKII